MTLTTQPLNAALDLTDGYGQRSASFRFELVNGATGGPLGEVTPLRTGTLSHDVNRTTKRSLSLSLGVADTAAINPITDRLDVSMMVGDDLYPLGRYVFTDVTAQRYTSGRLGSVALTDEMYVVDQEVETGVDARGRSVISVFEEILAPFPFEYEIEASDFTSAESWTAGQRRGSILTALSTTGGYFTPWFSSDGKIKFIRSFDPATQVPAFDLDSGHQVQRAGIVETNDLLSAPNRFVVVSNATEDGQVPVFGSADIPFTAPHSIANRGFVIPQVVDLQVTSPAQATAVARLLAIRNSPLEYVNLTTAVDPRHDSYDVIFWDNQLWLEVAWSMGLGDGSTMTHTLQKAYS